MSDNQTPRIPHWAAPVALAVLVVVLGAVALLRGEGNPDPMTPEGALHLYLEGIADSDYDQALRFLDPESFAGCTADDIDRSVGFTNPFTAIHLDTNERNGRATVRMEFRFGQGLGSYSQHEDFDMVQRDGFWYVTGNPWPIYWDSCR
ncbi:MAG: hypothetical protein DIU67_007010 [Actinomycetes bacterium]|nr:MAG: hypothetical protein DIU67_06285 [Actinomycetota bacterium]